MTGRRIVKYNFISHYFYLFLFSCSLLHLFLYTDIFLFKVYNTQNRGDNSTEHLLDV